MQSLSEVKVEEFDAVLTPQNVRQLQIIQAALAMGATMFAAIVLIRHILQSDPDTGSPEDAEQLLLIQSGVHALLALSVYVAAAVVGNVLLGPTRLARIGESVHDSAGGAAACLALLRTHRIVRLALLESAAFYGLVVCLVASLWGGLDAQPLFALNGLTYLILVMYAMATFPTRDNLRRLFEQKIASARGKL